MIILKIIIQNLGWLSYYKKSSFFSEFPIVNILLIRVKRVILEIGNFLIYELHD